MVVLQCASGVGKSRIIRDVCERLRQPVNGHDQGYWPELGVDAGPTGAVTVTVTLGSPSRPTDISVLSLR